MSFIVIQFIALEILLTLGAFNAEDPKVCLPELGCVQGVLMAGYFSDEFEAFLGVPFAEPPTGPLRFKNPMPVKPWQDILSATLPKPDCIQKNYLLDDHPVSGEEDCLYLNIYRPVERPNDLLPVMLYIYGGGFFCGSANPGLMDPSYFMDTQEVIIVIPNYRLGPFGFLSTGSEIMPGNLGLKDQQLALKWLQTNIATFGGDPESVTLFGHSAGAGAVHLHMLSESSKGLFQKAIVASGNALGTFLDYMREPLKQALHIAKAVNIQNPESLSDQELLNLLQAVDVNSLLDASDSLKTWHQFPLFNFRPTVEDVSWPDAFLTTAPIKLLKSGQINELPWLQSLVRYRGEGAVWTLNIFTHEDLLFEFNEDFEQRLWELMDLSTIFDEDQQRNIIDLLVEEYFKGQREVNNATLTGFSELFSDLGFYYPFWKSVKYYVSSAMPNNPLFLFKFNYHSYKSRAFIYAGGNPIDYGVVHMDDLSYLFRAPAIFPNDYEKASTNARLVREMVALYVDFAKYGDIRGLDACTETTFNDDSGICDYLEILHHVGKGYEKVTHNEFNLKRMQLWDNILAVE